MTAVLDTKRLCGLNEASCVCTRTAGRHKIHICDCGGQWKYMKGELVPVKWPSVFQGGRRDGQKTSFGEIPVNDPISALYAMLGDL